MINVVLDPVIVITPPDDATREEVEIWFEHLSLWLNEALTAPFTWLHNLEASNLLRVYRRFPEFGELKRLQKQYHLDINPTQIARRINDFFRNEDLDLAQQIKQLDFIIEPDVNSILIQPTYFITRLPEYIQENFYPLLVSCCACKHISLHFGEMLHIATLALPDNSKTITISTVMLAAVPDSLYNDGDAITQSFPLLITPDDLPALYEIVDLWTQGEKSIEYAIRQQIKKEAVVTHSTPFSFRLGPHFIQSVNKRGLDTNEIVLRGIMRATVNIVLDQAKTINSYSLHHLRISKTPGSPQRVRPGDDGHAWRLKLQENGAGWRLHYWQIPTLEGPMIEFANVCKESENDIL